ncbi:hypothetical protein T265_12069 [Opisthorchis viverrini]|uniref:Uncharacterized protein n=1 Tax=Opisthorchis viverrini TaxID=6198 RepID=A0A074YW30_OPIVI|nr:hypothetical protein T265_12069 [Opisthorchis viverrini]KER18981.1 hypothetical protein T265_12069 [Opisthorchis viverrini]
MLATNVGVTREGPGGHIQIAAGFPMQILPNLITKNASVPGNTVQTTDPSGYRKIGIDLEIGPKKLDKMLEKLKKVLAATIKKASPNCRCSPTPERSLKCTAGTEMDEGHSSINQITAVGNAKLKSDVGIGEWGHRTTEQPRESPDRTTNRDQRSSLLAACISTHAQHYSRHNHQPTATHQLAQLSEQANDHQYTA